MTTKTIDAELQDALDDVIRIAHAFDRGDSRREACHALAMRIQRAALAHTTPPAPTR